MVIPKCQTWHLLEVSLDFQAEKGMAVINFYTTAFSDSRWGGLSIMDIGEDCHGTARSCWWKVINLQTDIISVNDEVDQSRKHTGV